MDIYELAALCTVLGSAWKVVRALWKRVGVPGKKVVVFVLDAVIDFLSWVKHLLSDSDDDSTASNNGVTGGVLVFL